MLSSLCNVPLERIDDEAQPKSLFHCGMTSSSNPPRRQQVRRVLDPYSLDPLRVLREFEASNNDSSENLDSSSSSDTTAVPCKIPTKWRTLLNAPGISNDYYLNLSSWSKDNILSVIIQNTVYLWNGNNKRIHRLTKVEGVSNYGASVEWCTILPGQTHLLALATSEHTVQIWDLKNKLEI
jgi:hypothetical protein